MKLVVGYSMAELALMTFGYSFTGPGAKERFKETWGSSYLRLRLFDKGAIHHQDFERRGVHGERNA
jgi:hypothetical protein